MKHHLPAATWTKLFDRVETEGVPLELVRSGLELPSSTFYRKLSEHRNGGVGERRPGSGRPRVYDVEELEAPIREALGDLPPVVGHRRVHRHLVKQGIPASQNTVLRAMRDLDLATPSKPKRFTKFDPVRVDEPCLAWFVDTTEWRLDGSGEKVYIYLAVDAYSRYCPGLRSSYTEDGLTTVTFYEEIFLDGGLPVAVHTDPGSEFNNNQAKAYLEERGVQWVPGPPQTPQAQGPVERLVRTVKEERLSWAPATRIWHLQRVLDDVRDWYNTEREHSSLDYEVPEVVHRG